MDKAQNAIVAGQNVTTIKMEKNKSEADKRRGKERTDY